MHRFFITLFVGFGFLQTQADDAALSGILVEGHDWELIAEGFEFTDGLASDEAGNLYFSDVKAGDAIFRTDLTGKTEKFISDAPGISGIQKGSDGKFYACVARGQRVVSFTKDGSEKLLADEVRPNDLVVAHDGNLYFTMTPTKEIRRISPSGEMSVVNSGAITRPNGISLSPDQKTLAVSDHGGKFLWSFAIKPDGTLGEANKLATVKTADEASEVSRGDGTATDKNGRYYVTTQVGLQVFSKKGKLLGVIRAPSENPIVSTCFAGPDHTYLYVANGGSIYRRKTKTSGALFFLKPITKKE